MKVLFIESSSNRERVSIETALEEIRRAVAEKTNLNNETKHLFYQFVDSFEHQHRVARIEIKDLQI